MKILKGAIPFRVLRIGSDLSARTTLSSGYFGLMGCLLRLRSMVMSRQCSAVSSYASCCSKNLTSHPQAARM